MRPYQVPIPADADNFEWADPEPASPADGDKRNTLFGNEDERLSHVKNHKTYFGDNPAFAMEMFPNDPAGDNDGVHAVVRDGMRAAIPNNHLFTLVVSRPDGYLTSLLVSPNTTANQIRWALADTGLYPHEDRTKLIKTQGDEKLEPHLTIQDMFGPHDDLDLKIVYP